LEKSHHRIFQEKLSVTVSSYLSKFKKFCIYYCLYV